MRSRSSSSYSHFFLSQTSVLFYCLSSSQEHTASSSKLIHLSCGRLGTLLSLIKPSSGNWCSPATGLGCCLPGHLLLTRLNKNSPPLNRNTTLGRKMDAESPWGGGRGRRSNSERAQRRMNRKPACSQKFREHLILY